MLINTHGAACISTRDTVTVELNQDLRVNTVGVLVHSVGSAADFRFSSALDEAAGEKSESSNSGGI